MSVRLHSLKIPALALGGLAAAWLLFGWLALPGIIESQATEYLAARTGHRLTLDRPRFNPFTLKLQVANLRLVRPDGQPLIALRELTANLSLASLFRLAPVFDAVRLDGPDATLVLERDGQLNWSPLIDALAGTEASPPGELVLPRFAVRRFVMAGGRLEFADRQRNFATHISPLDLELGDLSTLPGDRGRYRISAQLGIGARMLWQGRSTLNPAGLSGSLAIENLDLARLAPYLAGVLPASPSGVAALAVDYRLSYTGGRLDLALENLQVRLAGFGIAGEHPAGPVLAIKSIEARNGRFDLAASEFTLGTLALTGSEITLPRGSGAPAELLRLGSLRVSYVHADVGARNLVVGHVELARGALRATRDPRGRLDWLEALRAASLRALPRQPGLVPEKAAPPWHFRVNQTELRDWSAVLRDETTMPPAELALDDITARAGSISDDLAVPVPVRASFDVRAGGRFEAAGAIVPGAPSAALQVKLTGLALKPARPYLAAAARLQLTGGRFSSEGRASYGRERGRNVARYQGGFALDDLRVIESDTGAVFLAWKSLASRSLAVTPASLDIGRLNVDGLYSKLVINRDRTLNLSQILRKAEPPAAPAAGEADAASAPVAPPPAALARKPPVFAVNIDRVILRDGEMDYADLSLILPFETRIHGLHGFINGLTSLPGAPGQVELDGQVDDYGIARAAGQVALFDPADYTDVRVMFANVEMTRLSPYSTTFAGRKIESGKLRLNLQYKIRQQKLAGDNQIVIDRITLGERVESPQALDLPLDLAIAILEDSDGRIDLGLPVSGTLSDPQFSYGGIVSKAILSLFKMIVTAPFRALASLFGGGVKLEPIYFDPGAAELSPPERENILHLAGALNKRPRLFVTVHGAWSEADRIALQDLQLRRKTAARAGIETRPGEDPGPLSTRTPKVQAALESLFAERFGRGELAAMKDGYRRANPGQMEEGFAGRMMSRLSSLFSSARTLEESEVQQLKGADFHAVLFGRLRASEDIPEADLQALAAKRGDLAYAALKAAQGPAERLALGAPQKGEAEDRGVPVKLDLGAAPKGAAAPAPARVPQ